MTHKIYRSNAADGAYTLVSTVEGNSAMLQNQPVGINYYKISKVNISGEGNKSGAIAQTVIGNPATPGIVENVNTITVVCAMPAYAVQLTLEGWNGAQWIALYSGGNTSVELPKTFMQYMRFRLRGTASNAVSTYSTEVQYTPTALATPILSVQQQGSSAKLTWPVIPNAAQIAVFQGGIQITSVPGSATECVVNNIVSAGIQFQIRALKGWAETVSNTVTYSPFVPYAPTGFVISAMADGIQTSWNNIPQATGYQIEFSGTLGTELINIGAGASSYKWPKSLATGSYAARIRSVYQGWESGWSNTATVNYSASVTYTYTTPANIVIDTASFALFTVDIKGNGGGGGKISRFGINYGGEGGSGGGATYIHGIHNGGRTQLLALGRGSDGSDGEFADMGMPGCGGGGGGAGGQRGGNGDDGSGSMGGAGSSGGFITNVFTETIRTSKSGGGSGGEGETNVNNEKGGRGGDGGSIIGTAPLIYAGNKITKLEIMIDSGGANNGSVTITLHN